MKRNKYGYLGLILACIAVVQYNYHLNEYVLLLLVVVSIALLWEFLDQKNLNVHRRENIELQEEIKSTAKDAHLKNKQLLTVVTSIPFPMLLVDQFGNIVMHNNVSELCEDGLIAEHMTYMSNAYLHPVREFITVSYTHLDVYKRQGQRTDTGAAGAL